MSSDISVRRSAPIALLLRTPAGQRNALLGAAGAALLGWTAYATSAMLGAAGDVQSAKAELAQREAEVAALRGKVALVERDHQRLRAVVKTTVARIEARQAHLNSLLGADKGGLVLASAQAPDADPVMPAADQAVIAPLERLEQQQIGLIDRATSATNARFQGAKALIRGLGLDPSRFTRKSRPAMGGPLDSAGEPSVQELYEAWNSLAELGEAIGSIPSRMPVESFSYTSGFGVRYDPFNGRAAMHAGLDMAGAYGEPILSAAGGIVVRAGWVNGYGNMIEVDHGRGITTRYGHLARIQVRPGDRVSPGDQIGKMGSTGRSTGTHLHFEVRVDGQAVDPMPYLRAAPQVAALKTGSDSAMGGPAVADASVDAPMSVPMSAPAPRD